MSTLLNFLPSKECLLPFIPWLLNVTFSLFFKTICVDGDYGTDASTLALVPAPVVPVAPIASLGAALILGLSLLAAEEVSVNLPGGRSGGGLVRSRSRQLLDALLGEKNAVTHFFFDDDHQDPAVALASSVGGHEHGSSSGGGGGAAAAANSGSANANAKPWNFFDDDNQDPATVAAAAATKGRKRQAVARAARRVDSAARQVCCIFFFFCQGLPFP